jgi:catechol 2,3-dioxygenase-like lactoylglutathione lyase family enzyme
MILGLSHIGLTTSDLESSLEFYREAFGFQVLSDAERRGEWIDRITGMPGFHARNVYLSTSRHQHLELFGFFNPKTLLAKKARFPQVGISYCALVRRKWHNLSQLGTSSKSQRLHEATEYVDAGCQFGDRAVILQDPDNLNLRVIEASNEESGIRDSSEDPSIYPGVIVENMEFSINFYRDILGLEMTGEGDRPSEAEGMIQNGVRMAARCALFTSTAGTCLELIQPLNTRILPARPWRMECIGFTHVAFAVLDLEKCYRQLLKHRVNFISPPRFVKAGPHSGGKAVYLSAPGGLILEFIDSPVTRKQLMNTWRT